MRLAGYDRNGDEVFDTDVLSPEELAEDQARARLERGGSSSDLTRRVRALQRPRVDEQGYDRFGNYHPERDGAA